MARFDGKVAVVTGGSKGIGRGEVAALAAEGARVAIVARGVQAGRQAAAEIVASGGEAIFVPADLSSPGQVADMGAAVLDAFGGVDFLVHNAIDLRAYRAEPLSTVDVAYLEYLLAVNALGALRTARCFIPSMRSRGGGAIVCQSSTAAWRGAAQYSVVKLALHGVAQGLARELGQDHIRANVIACGPIGTETTMQAPSEMNNYAWLQTMMAIPRMGEIADVVGACLFLLSDEARWITGHVLNVDGGQVMRA